MLCGLDAADRDTSDDKCKDDQDETAGCEARVRSQKAQGADTEDQRISLQIAQPAGWIAGQRCYDVTQYIGAKSELCCRRVASTGFQELCCAQDAQGSCHVSQLEGTDRTHQPAQSSPRHGTDLQADWRALPLSE